MWGVTVNAVLPGPTRTEGISQMLANESKRTGKSVRKLEQEFFSVRSPHIDHPAIVRAQGGVAAMAAYACSDLASSTTGATLRVEGRHRHGDGLSARRKPLLSAMRARHASPSTTEQQGG